MYIPLSANPDAYCPSIFPLLSMFPLYFSPLLSTLSNHFRRIFIKMNFSGVRTDWRGFTTQLLRQRFAPGGDLARFKSGRGLNRGCMCTANFQPVVGTRTERRTPTGARQGVRVCSPSSEACQGGVSTAGAHHFRRRRRGFGAGAMRLRAGVGCNDPTFAARHPNICIRN